MQDSVQSSLILKTMFISLFYDYQDIGPCWVCTLPKMCVPTVHHLTWHPCSTLPCWGECQCGHQGFPSPSRRTCGSPWWRGEPFSWNHCRETGPLMIQNATTPMLTIILQSIKQHWILVAWAFWTLKCILLYSKGFRFGVKHSTTPTMLAARLATF